MGGFLTKLLAGLALKNADKKDMDRIVEAQQSLKEIRKELRSVFKSRDMRNPVTGEYESLADRIAKLDKETILRTIEEMRKKGEI